MEELEAKQIVDACFDAGRSRENTVEIISALPLNGNASDIFEYVDLKYQTVKAVETFNFTDSENAEYFTAMYGSKLRYDHRRGRWLEWFNHYWRPDDDGQITRLALRSMKSRLNDTEKIQDNHEHQEAAKKAISSQQRARLDSIVALAHDFKPIADNGENWDKNQWLFAVPNGVIDLKSGTLRPGQQSDMITMRSPVEYDPEAKAPRWEQFLSEIFAGNTELIHWLHKFIGYALTGDTREQIIPIGYGNGANGKTVFISTLREVIGDYSYDAPFSTFELADRSTIPNDLAALDGKRFVTSSETNVGTRFNEARIKALTGQDAVTARFLHCEFFTFKPVAKFFLAVNHRPRVQDDSYGFWRRVRLIPFTQEFKFGSDDKELARKLLAEGPGILAWMVQGCLLWQKEGMNPTPECILTATKEYEAESDPLSEFILDECVLNPQAYVLSNTLYKKYKTWCTEQAMSDREILTTTAFGRRMGQKFKKIHKEAGTTYQGLSLKTDGLLTGSKAMITENQVNSYIGPSRGDNLENPSEPVNPSENPSFLDDCPKCHKNEWIFSKGDYVCTCGYRMAQ